MRRTNNADKRKLGWFGLAGLLTLLLSTPAWGLDFDHEVRKHEGDVSDVSSTLGHGRGFVASVKSKHHRDGMRLSLKKTKVKTHAKAKAHKPKAGAKRFAKAHHRGGKPRRGVRA